MRNKILAAALAFFGGIIGLHKFYLREPSAGIFYMFLAMMTSNFFPISMFLGFIDGMRYLMMPPEEFDRKFNRKYRNSRTKSRTVDRRRRRQREHYEVQTPKKTTRTTKRKAPKIRSNPFKKSGIRKYKDFEIEEAIEDFHKGLKIEPEDIALHFNLACAYSLMEDQEEGFKHLDLAVDYGLKDTDKILKHDDLAFLRIQPEFEAFKNNDFQVPGKVRRQQPTNTSTQRRIPVQEKKPMDDILLAQLNRLMELRKKGVLTEQEFTRERKKILLR